MNDIEMLATAFGLIQGALVMMNKRCNWIFYIIQMGLMLLFSWHNHLYGDTVNSAIYILLGFAGWFWWAKETDDTVCVSSTVERTIYICIIAVGTICLRAYLVGTDDPLPTIDAFTTVSSFVATSLMMMHRLDTWAVWFVNDIAYCVEYWMLPEQAMWLFGLNVIWTIMAIASFVIWKSKTKVAV